MFPRRILPVAVLARLVILVLALRGMFLIGEGRVTANLAGNLLAGRGYQLSASMLHPEDRAGRHPDLHHNTFEWFRRVNGFYGVLVPERPTMFLVPGYPVFEAGVFALAGGKSYTAVRMVQLALGLLTVFMGYRIASRFLRGRSLLFAGLFMAIYPFELYYEAIPATQGLFVPCFLGAVLLSLRLLEKPAPERAVAAALVWVISFYVRPVAIPFAVLLAVVLLLRERFSRRSIGTVALMVATTLVALSPWAIRNRSISGELRVMPTQGGLNLWETHGRIFSSHFEDEMAGASLLYEPIRRIYSGRLSRTDLVEFPDFTDEPEWVRDTILYERSLAFIAANPVLYGHLVLVRFVELFKPLPLNPYPAAHSLAGVASFFWILLFMVGGTIVFLERREAVRYFLALTVWGYVLMHLLTTGGIPHRVPIDMLLVILAMQGLLRFLQRARILRPQG